MHHLWCHHPVKPKFSITSSVMKHFEIPWPTRFPFRRTLILLQHWVPWWEINFPKVKDSFFGNAHKLPKRNTRGIILSFLADIKWECSRNLSTTVKKCINTHYYNIIILIVENLKWWSPSNYTSWNYWCFTVVLWQVPCLVAITCHLLDLTTCCIV